MANFIAGLVVVLIVGWACYYIYKNKKKGVKCIGCSAASTCSKCCSTKNKK